MDKLLKECLNTVADRRNEQERSIIIELSDILENTDEDTNIVHLIETRLNITNKGLVSRIMRTAVKEAVELKQKCLIAEELC
jgi:hypothetical protein